MKHIVLILCLIASGRTFAQDDQIFLEGQDQIQLEGETTGSEPQAPTSQQPPTNDTFTESAGAPAAEAAPTSHEASLENTSSTSLEASGQQTSKFALSSTGEIVNGLYIAAGRAAWRVEYGYEVNGTSSNLEFVVQPQYNIGVGYMLARNGGLGFAASAVAFGFSAKTDTTGTTFQTAEANDSLKGTFIRINGMLTYGFLDRVFVGVGGDIWFSDQFKDYSSSMFFSPSFAFGVSLSKHLAAYVQYSKIAKAGTLTLGSTDINYTFDMTNVDLQLMYVF